MVEYQSEFEKMNYQMEQLNPLFLEAYFVSSFIGGLRNEIAAVVRIFKPATVLEAAEQARLQELELQAQRTSSDRPNFFHFSQTLLTRLDPK